LPALSWPLVESACYECWEPLCSPGARPGRASPAAPP
jgi:hypothetical protein